MSIQLAVALHSIIIATMEPVVANAGSSTTAAATAAAWRVLEEDGGDSGVAGSGQMCTGNADPGPYSQDNYICLAGTLKPNANTIRGADDATCCIADNACPYPERCLASGKCMEGTAGIGCASCAPGEHYFSLVTSSTVRRKLG